jgi:glycosyltransferase involved in cell wall biosynthesis
VYAGALTPTYELEVAIDALASIGADRPELEPMLEMYGRGDAQPALERRVQALGLAGRVTFHGRIPIEDVPAAIARADIGLAPTRRSPFTDYSLSTKIFEYGAMARPVVASRLPMIERTFPAGSVATYEPGRSEDLAAAILRLVDEPLEREVRLARTTQRVNELSWANEGRRYRELVERLIDPRRGSTVAAAYPAL